MRYILVVGFFCDVYRKEPRARLYLNDQLIDEFFVQHYIKNKDLKSLNRKNKHQLEPVLESSFIEFHQQLVPPLRFYEINIDRKLKCVNIRIDIENNDNNYTNGFMNKNTLLQLRYFSILPMDKNIYDWFFQKIHHINLTYRYAWSRKKEINYFFDLTYSAEWRNKNNQKIIHKPNEHFNRFDIGGSGSIHCELIKKYGILAPKMIKKYKSYMGINSSLNKIIYDKYRQHENQ